MKSNESKKVRELKEAFIKYPQPYANISPEFRITNILAHANKLNDDELFQLNDVIDKTGANLLLHSAMHEAYNPLSIRLINLGFDVNNHSYTSYGFEKKPPLYLAAYAGNHKLVKALLKNGACVNLGEGSTTPIGIAIQKRFGWSSTPNSEDTNNNYDKVIKLLLKKGATINAQRPPYQLLDRVTSEGLAILLNLGLKRGCKFGYSLEEDFNKKDGFMYERQHVWRRAVGINTAISIIRTCKSAYINGALPLTCSGDANLKITQTALWANSPDDAKSFVEKYTTEKTRKRLQRGNECTIF